MSEALLEHLPADAYGRALLAGSAKPPAALPQRGAQVCTCFDVTAPQIDADERRLVSTLDRIEANARTAGIASPAILIVGDVLHGAAALAPAQQPRIALQN